MNHWDAINLLREGDQLAFRQVFDEYHKRVYAYIYKKTGSSWMAEETMQLTFVKLWKHRRSLKPELSLPTHIFRIATTTMIDLLRSEENKQHLLKVLKSRPDTDTGPGFAVEENELRKQVNTIVRRMPEMQQKVFEMSRFQEKSHREIAIALSISIKTVETHISRALKFLRQNLNLFGSIILLFLMTFFATNPAFAQPKLPDIPYPSLKQSLPYNRQEKQSFPNFTYQDSTDVHLTALRETYQLQKVAGTGADIQRAINLLAWFHQVVPHNDGPPLDTLTAENIITKYQVQKAPQGCWPLSIAMNEVFLSMGFKSRSVLCFSAKYPVPAGGHVINSVYIPSLNKWIYMDPQENAFIKDESGNYLSIAEVRERLIDGRPLILKPTANYHGTPTKKEEYLYTFMMEHLYRVICPVHSEWDGQSRHKGRTVEYIELLPYGSREPAIDGYETRQTANGRVICFHTNNDQLFWQLPG